MKKENFYTSILRKLSSQKEDSIMSFSFLNEIIYYTTHVNSTDIFINKIIDVMSKHIGPSAIYLIDDSTKSLFLKYSTIKNIPNNIELENRENFINILSKKGFSDLDIKQMELSKDISEYISSLKRFSILPVALKNVKLSFGILIMDINLENVELSKLTILNTALALLSNSINYSILISKTNDTAKHILKFILKIIRLSDLSTYKHSLRVRRYAIEIGQLLSLSPNEMKRLHISSLIHDIGKIAIPYTILHKNQKLSEKEFEIIKQHTNIGYNLLKDFQFFERSLPDILNHHETIDGLGYPNNIKTIDTVTQVLAIADIIDAISSTRAYKEDRGFSYIIEELKKLRGKYDDEILTVAIQFISSNRFLKLKKRLKTIEASNKNELMSSIGDMQEKINQLNSENKNLSKQLELYKQLLSKSQKTIEIMTEKTQATNKNSEKYKHVTETLFKLIKPISIVFIKIQNDTLNITRVKGSPINLENSIHLLSNKKILQSILSHQTFFSRKLVAFPLLNDEAVCAILSKDSKLNEKTLENTRKTIENIVK